MTRAERLARTEALARTQLARQRDRLAKVQAQQRAEERRALHKRHLVVGRLVLDTPLVSLDDTTLAGLFTLLAPLVQGPDPVAVLESLLASPECPAPGSVDGTAEAAPRVAPAVPVG